MNDKLLNGLIIVNKPKDISSAKVVAIVKRTLNVEKAGHAGTLDPFAEGVLVCCLNNATKLARFLLHDNKKYLAVLKLGVETDTQDFTGNVISENNALDLSEKAIRECFKQFEGTIEQQPPVYSALKHKGVPLYKLARRGNPVQKPSRRIHIAQIDICAIELPFIHFEVACSAGTYIRTLCADIGKSLGCGGHLHALKRTESSGFGIDQAVSLSAIKELAATGKVSRGVIPMADALPDIPAFIVGDDMVKKLRHGQMIKADDLTCGQNIEQCRLPKSVIKVIDADHDLVAILDHTKGIDRLDYCCVFPN